MFGLSLFSTGNDFHCAPLALSHISLSARHAVLNQFKSHLHKRIALEDRASIHMEYHSYTPIYYFFFFIFISFISNFCLLLDNARLNAHEVCNKRIIKDKVKFGKFVAKMIKINRTRDLQFESEANKMLY